MVADWKVASPATANVKKKRVQLNQLFICDSLSISGLSVFATIKTASTIFVGIDRTPIRLWPVSATEIRCSFPYLRSELIANYLADILISSPALLGSLDILGNPTNLIRSLALGVHDLVAIPLNEIRRGWGPGNVLRGVVKGWLGLLSHVADGALTSVEWFFLHQLLETFIYRSNDERNGLNRIKMDHVGLVEKKKK